MNKIEFGALACLLSLAACSASDSDTALDVHATATPKPGYKSYAKAKAFYSGKSVIPANGGYAFYLSPDGTLSSVPQKRKFTVNSSSLSDLEPLTVALVTGKAFRGRPHKNAIVTDRVLGKDALCSREETIFGKEDPICLPLYHKADGTLFEPAFNSQLIVFDGPDAFKAAARDYIADGNSMQMHRFAEAFPGDKTIASELETMVAEAKRQKAERKRAREEEKRVASARSSSAAAGLLGAFIFGALKAVSGSSNSSSTTASASTYLPTYEYVMKCRDRKLFGSDHRVEIPLGSCTGYESQCEQKLYNEIDTAGSFTSFCSKRLGSEYVTDAVSRKY